MTPGKSVDRTFCLLRRLEVITASYLLQVLLEFIWFKFEITFKFKVGILFPKADGSCFIFDGTINKTSDVNCVKDLTGPNWDPVYKVAYNKTHVFTCCRDGLIRKYDIGLF